MSSSDKTNSPSHITTSWETAVYLPTQRSAVTHHRIMNPGVKLSCNNWRVLV
ncbi:uncharacterized protein RAG0_00446 [Rhynchosporium agropyri]|uniref:Uncharacterized protein n=2 Tax=Rhynchosporium TaxID=38037 RepID=A0A1E1LZQ6_RHYSE|nr:uncharacterized protein RAG0_00446 [Rhynchosporium agropyri]CZT42340.1 uncharacterized protein RSE6_02208 [Rhynchosporium secalis]